MLPTSHQETLKGFTALCPTELRDLSRGLRVPLLVRLQCKFFDRLPYRRIPEKDHVIPTLLLH